VVIPYRYAFVLPAVDEAAVNLPDVTTNTISDEETASLYLQPCAKWWIVLLFRPVGYY